MKKSLKNVLRKDRVANLSYRVLTIVFKFLLSIIIVKNLSVHDLGVYGIFQTTITLLIYILGFDFYTFNTREILREEKNISFLLLNQVAFHAIVYILILPLILLLFSYNVISTEYIVYFYVILVVEHTSQEIYRILITLKRSVIASLSLFLRSGIWIFILYVAWTYNLSSGTITDIFSLWFIGALISIIVGLFGIGFKSSI